MSRAIWHYARLAVAFEQSSNPDLDYNIRTARYLQNRLAELRERFGQHPGFELMLLAKLNEARDSALRARKINSRAIAHDS